MFEKQVVLLVGTVRIHQDFDLHLNQVGGFDEGFEFKSRLILIKNRRQGDNLRL